MSGKQWRLYCPECASGHRKMHTEVSGGDGEKRDECNNCGHVRPTSDGLVSESERADYKL